MKTKWPKHTRHFAILSTVVTMGSVFATLGTAGASTTTAHPTFVYLQTNGEQSYFVLEGKGATAEGAKLGATVHVENENNSSATTISDEQAAIAAGDQGVIIVAPAASLGPRLVAIATKAHVAIEASDNGFAGSNGKQVPFVGINATAFGANTGKLLVGYYKQSHWTASSTYMLLYVVPSLPTCNERTNAEKAALLKAGLPASHIINVPYDGTSTAALNATGPVLTAHPQATHWLAAGCNDDGVYGGLKAATSHGVSVKNLLGVGLGGDLACQIWAKGAPNVGFVATNYIYPNAIGATAVEDMYNYVVKHKPFPANTYVTPIPIDRSNFRKVDKAC
ncbi:MAG: substrate-binding domain-containing protein [Actinomycetota bacterium]|nr:substrate-binding domain-containing protein [Actinomycetota bacterium]